MADKITKTVFDCFIGLANDSKHKPNKLWVDQGGEFYNNQMQKLLDDNDFHVLDS